MQCNKIAHSAARYQYTEQKTTNVLQEAKQRNRMNKPYTVIIYNNNIGQCNRRKHFTQERQSSEERLLYVSQTVLFRTVTEFYFILALLLVY